MQIRLSHNERICTLRAKLFAIQNQNSFISNSIYIGIRLNTVHYFRPRDKTLVSNIHIKTYAITDGRMDIEQYRAWVGLTHYIAWTP